MLNKKEWQWARIAAEELRALKCQLDASRCSDLWATWSRMQPSSFAQWAKQNATKDLEKLESEFKQIECCIKNTEGALEQMNRMHSEYLRKK